MSYRSMRNRQFDTLEEALADDRRMADEQIAADRLAKEQEEAATTATGLQFWWFVAAIVLTFIFPPLGMVLLGLSFLIFNSGRNR